MKTAPFKHTVQFYQDDAFLVRSLVPSFKDALDSGHAVLIVATPAHVAAAVKGLKGAGVPVDDHIAAGRLELRDAAATLASVLVGGWPDAARFDLKVGRLVRRLIRRHGQLLAFGEMVDLLWQERKRDVAIEIESQWNLLLERFPFRLACAYRIDVLDPTVEIDHFEHACRCHDHSSVSQEPETLRDAFFRAVRQAVPTHHREMLESWLANGGFHEGAQVSQGLIWLRRYMPELSATVLGLTRSLIPQ
jgi:hypothetical protein